MPVGEHGGPRNSILSMQTRRIMQQCLSRPARNGERTRVRLRVFSPALALRPAGSLGRSTRKSITR